jgi:hypothetical protein
MGCSLAALFPLQVVGGKVENSRSSDNESDEETSKDIASNEIGLIRLFAEMHAARKDLPEVPSLSSVMLSRRGFGVSDVRDLVYGHPAIARLPSRKNSPLVPLLTIGGG